MSNEDFNAGKMLSNIVEIITKIEMLNITKKNKISYFEALTKILQNKINELKGVKEK